ncbi:DUF2971 domain-containing protein, partial [Cecembia lonarensis]|uniref:DUF2971 domain-containing protein n=1 Tax=Cecembia lonarensis TaxID=645110 RepID=UPI00138AC5A5
MSQASFLRMLQQGALYFRNIPMYSQTDPFEGVYGWGKGYEQFIAFHKRECERAGNGMHWQTWTLMHFLDHEIERRKTYISCWYMDEHESEAMWRLYCNNQLDNAIAIRTTVGKLKAELFKASLYNMYIGKVKYEKDFYWKSRHITPEIFFYKRKSFEYERELRVAFQEKNQDLVFQNKQEAGKLAKVNLENLIEEVRLSPFYKHEANYTEL